MCKSQFPLPGIFDVREANSAALFRADYRGEHLLTKFCVTRKIWTKVNGLLFFESDKFSIFILKFAGLKKGLLRNLFCFLHIHRNRDVDPEHRVRDILRYSKKKILLSRHQLPLKWTLYNFYNFYSFFLSGIWLNGIWIFLDFKKGYNNIAMY